MKKAFSLAVLVALSGSVCDANKSHGMWPATEMYEVLRSSPNR